MAVGKIHELRATLTKAVDEANAELTAAQEAAETENRDLTAEELAAQDAHDAKIKSLKAQVDAEQRRIDRLAQVGQFRVAATGLPDPSVVVGETRADSDPRRGFGIPRDFLMAAMRSSGARSVDQITDPRLQPLAQLDPTDIMAAGGVAFMLPAAFTPASLRGELGMIPDPRAAAGSDEQGSYQDRYGGFAVETSVYPDVLSIGMESDPTAGRTMNIPMATPSVGITARTDKDHSTSVSGGLIVTRRPETVAVTSSRLEIERITLRATVLAGLAFETEELLTDSPISFMALIDAGFRDQFAFHMLNEKLRGGGGNEFIGVISAPATVSVAKESSQVADTIVAENVLKMRARCWGYGQAIWLANHDTYPQLAVAAVEKGTAGVVAVYQPSLVAGRPDMLLGRPIFYSEHPSTLGDKGDLILGNWSQYLEGLYQPLMSAESVHVRFVEHERTFKFWLRNAGAPWWRSPLTPHKGSTLSPFVVLNARS